MKSREQTIYTVVLVWRGIVSQVRTFNNEQAAEECRREFAKASNPQEDDVAVFETVLA